MLLSPKEHHEACLRRTFLYRPDEAVAEEFCESEERTSAEGSLFLRVLILSGGLESWAARRRVLRRARL